MPRQLTQFEVGQIVARINTEDSYRTIALAMGRSKEAIRKVHRKILETGSAARRQGSGRPRNTTPRTDAAVLREVRVRPRTSCVELRRAFEGLQQVSLRTVER